MVDYWSTRKLKNTESIHTEKRCAIQIEMFKQCFKWLKDNIDIKLDEKWQVLEAGQGKYGFSSLYSQYFDTVYGADLEDYSKYHPGVKSLKADFCKKFHSLINHQT